MKKWLRYSACLFLLSGICITAMIIDVQIRYGSKIYTLQQKEIPSAPVALVLGASVTKQGLPSDALRDRLLVAKALYEQKVISVIFLTGDDGRYRSTEIPVMKNFLLTEGIPAEAIQEDGEGYRTYESCKRAVSVFHIDRAIIITQRFHMARSLYLCNQLGMDAIGVTADLNTYQRILFFTFRDLLASVKAWWDIHIDSPESPVS